MDTNALLAHSKARLNHAAQKRLIREKYEARMVFGYNGGMWRATPEMITFLSLYGDQSVVVPDLYQNPIRFQANVLCDLMKCKWQEQMTAWELEYQQSMQQR
jgi:hypothetical protein